MLPDSDCLSPPALLALVCAKQTQLKTNAAQNKNAVNTRAIGLLPTQGKAVAETEGSRVSATAHKERVGRRQGGREGRRDEVLRQLFGPYRHPKIDD
jgi:hypothetical protein